MTEYIFEPGEMKLTHRLYPKWLWFSQNGSTFLSFKVMNICLEVEKNTSEPQMYTGFSAQQRNNFSLTLLINSEEEFQLDTNKMYIAGFFCLSFSELKCNLDHDYSLETLLMFWGKAVSLHPFWVSSMSYTCSHCF